MNINQEGKNVFKVIGWIIIGLLIAAATAFLFGFFVMLLWNWLMPSIFGLNEISYIQAWGLVLLAHILFKSGHSGNGRHGWKKHRRFGGRFHNDDEMSKEDWKRRFHSKMKDHDFNHEHKEENKKED
jgi:hypothetical protein